MIAFGICDCVVFMVALFLFGVLDCLWVFDFVDFGCSIRVLSVGFVGWLWCALSSCLFVWFGFGLCNLITLDFGVVVGIVLSVGWGGGWWVLVVV